MIPKKNRLITKEVNYILHKRQTISCPDFLFFIVPQYINRSYNQFSLQLSTKVHKRSTKRNKLRRIFYDSLQNQNCLNEKNNKIGDKYYKTIAMLHKTKVNERNLLLNEINRQEISKKIQYNIERFKKT